MNEKRDGLIVAFMIMCLVLLVKIMFQNKTISILNDRVSYVEATTAELNDRMNENNGVINSNIEGIFSMFDTHTDMLLQLQLDNAWYDCRISHDLDVLFGGDGRSGYHRDNRLNYPCSNDFYLDEKPTVGEFLGE